MRLDDIFISLYTATLSESLKSNLLKRCDLEFALKKAVSSYRCFGDSSKIAAYQHFLRHCERALDGLDDMPLIGVLINSWADTDSPDKDEIAACDKLTQLFNLAFQDQLTPLGIASLGRSFIDRPKAFAAFLRCLLQKEITPIKLLVTGLLQDFFRYYLSAQYQASNPIETLYRLLDAFPETRILHTLARRTCCEERGLSSYALDGSNAYQSGRLHGVAVIHTPVQFTVNATNLNMLRAIFGVDFLMGALAQWDPQKYNAVWHDTITELFNDTYTVNSLLPHIVNRIHEYTALQSVLAEVLNECTLAIMVERHVVGIFNLIPFSQYLAESIKTCDLSGYFQALHQQSTSGAALTSSLFALFNGVKKVNEESAILVFDALLDSIHTDPSLLDDSSLLRKLRKFDHLKLCVTQKARALESRLDTVIKLQTQSSIENMDYIDIEDVWCEVNIKIQHLQDIDTFKTTCPEDKYKLYNRLAKAFVERHQVNDSHPERGTHASRSVAGSMGPAVKPRGFDMVPQEFGDTIKMPQYDGELNLPFDLDTFARAVGMEPAFSKTDITPYERMVIELLATIDHEKFRANCIQLLDHHVVRPWRIHVYGEHSLFKQATLAGNLGLIKWMSLSRIKIKDSHESLVISAAMEHQWSVVAYFHAESPLNKGILNKIVDLAVKGGASHVIPLLFSGNKSMPTLDAIETAFKEAVKKNDIDCVVSLMNCPQKPCDTMMAHAYRHAIKFKYHDLARIIAMNSSGKFLQDAIMQNRLSPTLQQQGLFKSTVNLVKAPSEDKLRFNA